MIAVLRLRLHSWIISFSGQVLRWCCYSFLTRWFSMGITRPSFILTHLEWNKREIWIIIKFCFALTKCEMKFKRCKLIINKFWGGAANSWQKQSKVVSICVALTHKTEQIKLVKIVGIIIVVPVCIVIAWVLSYDTISYTY